jgi:hypothetical protein
MRRPRTIGMSATSSATLPKIRDVKFILDGAKIIR